MEHEMNCFGYCIVIPEEEMDKILAMENSDNLVDSALDTECYIRMGRYDVNGAGEIYDKATGKYVGKLEKPINRY